ncbi:MAG: M48 family metallopeptidase [Pseudomonadales bacterium]
MNDYVHQIDDREARQIRRFLRGLVWGVLGFVLLIVLAYLTADRWLLLISPESERRFIEPYVELARDNVLQTGDLELEAYVAGLADELADQMHIPDGLKLDVQLIKSEQANAVTTLGGYIFVTDGLLKVLDNENSLAMVLAHEIAHAGERHPLLGTGRGMLIALLISALSGSNPTPATVGDLGSQLMLYSYGRDQEEAADHLALAALHSRYGHVGGAKQLFEYFAGADEGGEVERRTSDVDELFSTHPNLTRRIDYIDAATRQQGWQAGVVTAYPEAVEERIRQL